MGDERAELGYLSEAERSGVMTRYYDRPRAEQLRIGKATQQGKALASPSEQQMQYALLARQKMSVRVHIVVVVCLIWMWGQSISDGNHLRMIVGAFICAVALGILIVTTRNRRRLMRDLGLTKESLR